MNVISIVSMPCVSVICDKCGYGFDEVHATPSTYMSILKNEGWTGTYRKCYCPNCSKIIATSVETKEVTK